MMKQLKILRRVKELKEDQAFRAMQAKRRQVDEGKRAADEASRIVEESAATLPARQDAVYAEIMGKIIDLGNLDDTRGKIVNLDQAHAQLADAKERAAHVLARLDQELVSTTDAYRVSVKKKDKYVILTDDLRAQLTAFEDLREETEVEDLFGSRRRPPL